MFLTPCTRCEAHVFSTASACPHCEAPLQARAGLRSATALALGLSLGLAGCAKSTAIYGAPVTDTVLTDNDLDGFTVSDGDCDDENAEVYPGAEETPGDGVDSNCDGADDT